MSQLVPFQAGGNNLPAHIAAAFGDSDNIPERQTLPTLSYRGKVWRLVLQGKETILTRKDPNTGAVYFWEILIPGSLVGLIVGFATQRYGVRAPTRA